MRTPRGGGMTPGRTYKYRTKNRLQVPQARIFSDFLTKKSKIGREKTQVKQCFFNFDFS